MFVGCKKLCVKDLQRNVNLVFFKIFCVKIKFAIMTYFADISTVSMSNLWELLIQGEFFSPKPVCAI